MQRYSWLLAVRVLAACRVSISRADTIKWQWYCSDSRLPEAGKPWSVWFTARGGHGHRSLHLCGAVITQVFAMRLTNRLSVAIILGQRLLASTMVYSTLGVYKQVQYFYWILVG